MIWREEKKQEKVNKIDKGREKPWVKTLYDLEQDVNCITIVTLGLSIFIFLVKNFSAVF